MSQETIVQLIASFLNRTPEEIVPEQSVSSLVSDSFALVELAIYLQEETDVLLGHEDFEGVTTVAELVALFTEPAQDAELDRVG